MMKNRIVRLSTVALSLFAVGVFYGVSMNAQDQVKGKNIRSANKKGSRYSKQNRQARREAAKLFRVKIDKSGDISKYTASGVELKEKISTNLTPEKMKMNPEYETAAFNAVRNYVSRAGLGKFTGDEHYKVAISFLNNVAPKFTNVQLSKKLQGLKVQLNDPKVKSARKAAAEKMAVKKARWAAMTPEEKKAQKEKRKAEIEKKRADRKVRIEKKHMAN